MTPTEFLTLYFPFALQAQKKYGVPAQVILAQAALESGWGKSKLSTEGYNFFGIKADGSWNGATITKQTREVRNGKEVYEAAKFRKYATPLESFDDHSKFLLKNPRYKAAFDYQGDPKAFAAEVAKAGYATDPKYTELIHKLIDSSSGILSKISTVVTDTLKKKPLESGLFVLGAAALLFFALSKSK